MTSVRTAVPLIILAICVATFVGCPPQTDDHSNTFAGATQIQPDAGPVGGELTRDDVDFFTFDAAASMIYEIKVIADTPVNVNIYNNNRALVATDTEILNPDPATAGLWQMVPEEENFSTAAMGKVATPVDDVTRAGSPARFRVKVDGDTSFYVAVRVKDVVWELSNFSVEVTTVGQADVGDTMETATAMEMGDRYCYGPMPGVLETAEDIDFYSFTAMADYEYMVSVIAEGCNAIDCDDVLVHLYNADGAILNNYAGYYQGYDKSSHASYVDGLQAWPVAGFGANFVIDNTSSPFWEAGDQTFYVAIELLGAPEVEYSISVCQMAPTDDVGNTASTATEVTVTEDCEPEGPYELYFGDFDVFRFWAEAGTSYRIETSGDIDTMLGVWTQKPEVISIGWPGLSDDDDVDLNEDTGDRNAVVLFRAEETSWVYVGVSAYNSGVNVPTYDYNLGIGEYYLTICPDAAGGDIGTATPLTIYPMDQGAGNEVDGEVADNDVDWYLLSADQITLGHMYIIKMTADQDIDDDFVQVYYETGEELEIFVEAPTTPVPDQFTKQGDAFPYERWFTFNLFSDVHEAGDYFVRVGSENDPGQDWTYYTIVVEEDDHHHEPATATDIVVDGAAIDGQMIGHGDMDWFTFTGDVADTGYIVAIDAPADLEQLPVAVWRLNDDGDVVPVVATAGVDYTVGDDPNKTVSFLNARFDVTDDPQYVYIVTVGADAANQDEVTAYSIAVESAPTAAAGGGSSAGSLTVGGTTVDYLFDGVTQTYTFSLLEKAMVVYDEYTSVPDAPDDYQLVVANAATPAVDPDIVVPLSATDSDDNPYAVDQDAVTEDADGTDTITFRGPVDTDDDQDTITYEFGVALGAGSPAGDISILVEEDTAK